MVGGELKDLQFSTDSSGDHKEVRACTVAGACQRRSHQSTLRDCLA
jgi:hypothetical protein